MKIKKLKKNILWRCNKMKWKLKKKENRRNIKNKK